MLRPGHSVPILIRRRLQTDQGVFEQIMLPPVSTPAKHPSWLHSGKGCLPRSLFPRVKYQMTKCQTEKGKSEVEVIIASYLPLGCKFFQTDSLGSSTLREAFLLQLFYSSHSLKALWPYQNQQSSQHLHVQLKHF